MAEGEGSPSIIYHISFNALQNVKSRTDIRIADSAIEQVIIHDPNQEAADDPNDDAAEDPNNDAAEYPNNVAAEDPNSDAAEDPNNDAAEDSNNVEEDAIIGGVEEMNLSSPIPTSVRRKNKVSSNRGNSVSNQTRSNENRGGKQSSLRCELLKDQASTLCREGNYLQAASILEKLIQQEDIGVSALILFAETSVQLGRKQEAKKAIGDVVSLSSPSDCDDVFRHASDLFDDKSYVRAIVLLRISSDMFKLNPSLSPDDIVERICKCVKKIHDAVEPMIESGDKLKLIALDYGLPYMVEMVGDLRSVKNSDQIIAKESEGWCMGWIGENYMSAKENEKAIEFFKSGVDVMKRQFGNNASNYRVYGGFLHKLGFAYSNIGRHSIAEDYRKEAIDAFNNATDICNDVVKQLFISQLQGIHSLKKLTENME